MVAFFNQKEEPPLDRSMRCLASDLILGLEQQAWPYPGSINDQPSRLREWIDYAFQVRGAYQRAAMAGARF